MDDKRQKYVKIKNYKLHANISKRSRGHIDTIVNVNVTSMEELEPIDFIGFFGLYNESTLTNELLLEIASNMLVEMKLKDVKITFSFMYPIDRISPGYSTVTYDVPCSYTVDYPFLDKEGKPRCRVSASVKFPVQIKNVLVIPGELKFTVSDISETLHFEDMIDHLQKLGSSKLYPIVSSGDNSLLQDELYKSPDAKIGVYFENLINKSVKQGWNSGTVVLNTNDLYNIYELEYGVTWNE